LILVPFMVVYGLGCNAPATVAKIRRRANCDLSQ
jgi:hypothetical protein